MHAEATMAGRPPCQAICTTAARVLHDDKSASQTRDKTHQRDGVERLPEVRAARTSLSADSPRTTWERSQIRCSNDGCMHKDEAVARPQCQTQFPIARQRYVVVVLGSPVKPSLPTGLVIVSHFFAVGRLSTLPRGDTEIEKPPPKLFCFFSDLLNLLCYTRPATNECTRRHSLQHRRRTEYRPRRTHAEAQGKPSGSDPPRIGRQILLRLDAWLSLALQASS